jgi:2-hydroxychromene-2-carboxylate isomerase
MAERLRRSVVPSTIIRLSAVDGPARASAALRRAIGQRGRVELYFAFDDPCSAIAVIDLAERLGGRPVDLVALPVVQRGIPGDAAFQAKREYAIADARRLGRRRGLELTREEPLAAAGTAFLAEWVAGAADHARALAFCAAALQELWFASAGSLPLPALVALWEAHVGGEPSPDPVAVRANELRMARRGPYDTPAAVIGRDWWFAHDRLAQIAERLDDLGWTAAP